MSDDDEVEREMEILKRQAGERLAIIQGEGIQLKDQTDQVCTDTDWLLYRGRVYSSETRQTRSVQT